MKFKLSNEVAIQEGKSVLVFDTDCLFCNRALLLLLFLERKDHFMIAARNSSAILAIVNSDEALAREDSIILLTNSMAYTKADALKRIALKLNYAAMIIATLIWLIPNPIINAAYNWVAKKRLPLSQSTKCNILNKEKFNHKTFSR
ncbi:DCC1-like thiol-disulfide oxidoreductase family protein [Williamwhitmania taraxaci]|uniref:Predicted thiol-disulfide oxidoreductase YuxK, DCC family n=1 Tax=Williamwhitmania taraxaci TaxID=1640674 RepID=A0A1G6HMZ5_9BACT|nr:DCC1-like thiol-disulfide oxidoreductase family protein [Williamwhitmania taraxaci]SDB95601.1 Predicted thiol-disulfide oxidoreductase YuxK, DCC family [Williamwhitmania taraxaci]